MNKHSEGGTSRRRLLKVAAAASGVLAAPSVARRAFAAERLIVAQPGGPYETGWSAAFGVPFTKETGIEVVFVPRPFFPSGQVQAQVETHSYQWDIVSLSTFDVEILGRKNMLEPFDLTAPGVDQLMPEARRPNWLGLDVYGTVLAYRTDTYKTNGPASWADLWDVSKFPGRRAMYKSPIGTLEIALLADGVAPKDLYPLDITRALKKLGQIRTHIKVWWEGGAQSTQMLHDHDVDLLSIWNGRAQAAIDDGTPAKVIWNDGLSTIHGLAIPKGAPKKKIAAEFINYCVDAKRQSIFPKYTASGVTNLRAYDYISPELAQNLPTSPQNIKKVIQQNTAWWTDHKDEAVNRFTEWLLS